jgi:hypothetical protein
MDTSFIIGGALATFLNFAIIKWKLEHNRYLDSTIDIGVFSVSSYMFMGTITGLSISMIASALMSIYLLISPPKFFSTTSSNSPKH